MKMNTSVRERRAPQQHMPHGVEGNQIPHTGPKAFAAVEQNEARKQSTTTLQAIFNKARQPGRRKKQPDTQREGPVKLKNYWARTPHGNNRGGREGGDHNYHKPHNREPKCKGGGTQRPQRRHVQSKGKQASKEGQTTETHTKGPKQKAEQETTQRARKAQPPRGARQEVDLKRGMQ